MTPRGTGLVLAGCTAAISGVAVYVNANGVRAFGDATAYTTAKNAVAAVLLAGIALAVGRVRDAERPRLPSTRRGWVGLVAIGVIGGSVPFVLFFEGLARASSADAAFLHKTLVLWVALLAVPLLGERVGRLQAAAVVLLLGGYALLGGGLPQLTAGGGEVLVLAATLLWAGEVVVAKRVLAEVPAATVGLARMGVGSVVLIVWTVATRGAGVLTVLTAQQWWWALVTGALLAGYVATWLSALSRAPAVDVTAVLAGGAVLTALLQSGIGGAALAPALPGMGLVGLAIALVVLGGARRNTVEASDR
jgi:drug/metabolite transporter (DMT)-like permease